MNFGAIRALQTGNILSPEEPGAARGNRGWEKVPGEESFPRGNALYMSVAPPERDTPKGLGFAGGIRNGDRRHEGSWEYLR